MQTFFRLNRLLVLFIGLGLIVLAFEVFTMHYDRIFSNHVMWTPVIFGVTGGILTLLIFLLFTRLSYYGFILIMLMSACVGFLGLYFHNRWRFPIFYDFFFHHKPFAFNVLTTFTPFLAPSAFIAIGGLGILVAFFEPWGKEKNQN